MTQIAMLLSNPFRPDPRVLKEATSLTSLGHQVTILCWDRAAELPEREVIPSGVQVIRIQNVRSTYGIGAAQLRHLPVFWKAIMPHLDRIRPHIVHCHDFDTLPAGLFWGRRHRIPVIYDAHEYYAELVRPRLHGVMGKILFRFILHAEMFGAKRASAILTVDETLGDIYRSLNPRVLIVGHYPSKNLVPQPAAVFQHEQLSLLYMGRLSVDRGILTYVDILRALIHSRIPAQLHLAGVFTPASEKTFFDQRAIGLEEFIHIHGWVQYNKVPDLMTGADLGMVILQPEPRYVAALPVKLFEYMAAGLPVIASDFPPIAKLIGEAQCGLLVDPKSDPTDIAKLIIELWQDKPLAQRLGQNGHQAVIQKYNWENLTIQLEGLYSSLIEK